MLREHTRHKIGDRLQTVFSSLPWENGKNVETEKVKSIVSMVDVIGIYSR
jgi:hypothetical protein